MIITVYTLKETKENIKMTDIKCVNCGSIIEIDKALEKQVEGRVILEMGDKHRREMEGLKEQITKEIKEENEEALKREAERIKKKNEIEVEELKKDIESQDDVNKKLREKLDELLDQLKKEKETRENVELESKKKMLEESDRIREEARKKAAEEYELKLKEKEKQLKDTTEALEEAKRKAEQGSQQTQGEVLELELEECLRREFAIDDIVEVKKGQRGVDIKQVVKNMMDECGTILWEAKNAAWNPGWIQKFREDVREANATIGILVSANIPEKHGDIFEIEGIWITRPRYALAVGGLIRAQIVGINTANRNAQNKDVKMDILYSYLVGPEFKHRVGAIVDNYKTLQDELNKEKKSAETRWARQEKVIGAVIKNTAGMYGDFQGLIGSTLGEIKQLEAGDDEDTE